MERYDVIVVGAGSGGCLAALTAASNGCRVLIIERRKSSEIGAKVSYDSIKPDIFGEVGIPLPEGEELDDRGNSLRIYAPGKRSWADCIVPNLLVHRGLFGRRLVGYALEAGATLVDEAEVIDVLTDADALCGARFRRRGLVEEVSAGITIDAGGFFAPVRSRLPESVLPRFRIDREDTVAGYREVRVLEGNGDLIPPPGYDGYYDFLGYQGGYLWAVREAGRHINVGIGVLDLPDGRSPAEYVAEFCRDNPAIGRECIARGHGGSPYIPLRRCLPRLVGNGFMAVGDAAWQVCPGTGYGVYPALAAGKLAGEVAARAVASGHTSLADLWPYDHGWKSSYGARFAFIDCIRMLVQSLPGRDLDYLMGRGLIGSREFSAIWVGEIFRYGALDYLRKTLAGLGRPALLVKLALAYRAAMAAYRLYRAAPREPDGFKPWHQQERELFASLKQVLGLGSTPGGYEEARFPSHAA